MFRIDGGAITAVISGKATVCLPTGEAESERNGLSDMTMARRDDFTTPTKEKLRRRVNSHCSRPECDAPTEGPSLANEKHVSIGVAAHICGAAPGAKRYDALQTPEERRSYANGIWLCQSCSRLIDTDEARFPAPLLREWKQKTEKKYLLEIGKPQSRAEYKLASVTPAKRFGATSKVLVNDQPALIEYAFICDLSEAAFPPAQFFSSGGYALRFNIKKRSMFSYIIVDELVAAVLDFQPIPRCRPLFEVRPVESCFYLVELDRIVDGVPRSFPATRCFENQGEMKCSERLAQPFVIDGEEELAITVGLNACRPGLYTVSLDVRVSADEIQEVFTVLAPTEIILAAP